MPVHVVNRYFSSLESEPPSSGAFSSFYPDRRPFLPLPQGSPQSLPHWGLSDFPRTGTPSVGFADTSPRVGGFS